MVTPPVNPLKTPMGELHRRRVRLMLWLGSFLLTVLGTGWGVFFAIRGAWINVVIDLAMVLVGLAIGVLTQKKRTRMAFFLFIFTAFWVICAISLFFDVPSALAPRSTHHFLIVLAVSALLFLHDDRPVLRYLVTGICLLAFVVLASTNASFAAHDALPDSVRITGTWVNNTFSAASLYALTHIMMTDMAEQSFMATELRKGIGREEFFLVYQPQVTSTGTVIGAEALLRWQHPKLGQVGPDEFIPLAEQTGLILPLGAWVLRKACTQLVAWSHHADTADLMLSVNVSAQQFRQPNFVDLVLSTVQLTGVRPHRLKLELTESSLVHDIEDIIQKMTALKAMGVGFSLDDFGTGYSSLSYLKRLPLDQLKIDQSFVRDVLTDEHDAAIARMVIDLGKNLGFTVIAEGVETRGQRAFLVGHDCHLFQGYLFSKPIPIEQFPDYCLHSRVPAQAAA